jgi:hypothetical protein
MKLHELAKHVVWWCFKNVVSKEKWVMWLCLETKGSDVVACGGLRQKVVVVARF